MFCFFERVYFRKETVNSIPPSFLPSLYLDSGEERERRERRERGEREERRERRGERGEERERSCAFTRAETTNKSFEKPSQHHEGEIQRIKIRM